MLHQRASEKDSLLLSTGKFSDVSRTQTCEAESVEDFIDVRVFTSGQAWPRSGLAPTHRHDLADGDGKIPVHCLQLRDVTDSKSGCTCDVPMNRS
jgi:hypothetical protein